MKDRRVVRFLCLLSASVPLAGNPMAAEPRFSTVRVVVHDSYYVTAMTAVDDLDTLERAVLAASPRSVEMVACGSEANRALLSAAHRFSQLPQQLQVVDGSAAPCAAMPMAVRVGQPFLQRPTGIDDASVDSYWRQVAP